MKVVLDTSAIIFLNDFRSFDEIITVPEVIEEVKDQTTSMKLFGLNLKIIEPSEDSVKEIKKVAKETGDMHKLSNTDIKVLALAKENNSKLISDDRCIQNVAEKIGIECISIYNKKITRVITWKRFCKSCRKEYDDVDVCSTCGTILSRKPTNSKDITGKSL
jgi:endoribonuclease Nob1